MKLNIQNKSLMILILVLCWGSALAADYLGVISALFVALMLKKPIQGFGIIVLAFCCEILKMFF